MGVERRYILKKISAIKDEVSFYKNQITLATEFRVENLYRMKVSNLELELSILESIVKCLIKKN